MRHAISQNVLMNATIGAVVFAMATDGVAAAELRIGAAAMSITPAKPVALDGQFGLRVSRGVDNPIMATAVAIEAWSDGRSVDQAILVSCDIVAIRPPIPQLLRDRLRQKLPDIDPRKVILTATHTHTAPVTEEGKYAIPKEGVMQPSEYVAFLLDRLEEVIARAWTQRQPGGVSWGLGHAVVGHNRRAVYADGTAQMYGTTTSPAFRGLEGGEDHGLEMLFLWNQAGKPIAVGINVACPSQEVEGLSTLNADFWHDVREQLHAAVSKDLFVLAWPGASGDLSPHRMYRKAVEDRMVKLRGLTWTREIARRIVREVQDVSELARRDIRSDVRFEHKVEDLALPVRKVTEKEVADARSQIEKLSGSQGDVVANQRRRLWFQETLDRYRDQEKEPTVQTEVHVLRVGDIAIATNPFELFQDYGVQTKARSKALQTFVIQLTNGSGGYLPTRRAVEGGGYSAVVQSNPVGPEGGQMLVVRTVDLINALWTEPVPGEQGRSSRR
jgi:hypothetical protein